MNTNALIRPAWTPATIALMVIGFMVFWPLGLAMLAYIIWGDRLDGFKRDVNRATDGIFAGCRETGFQAVDHWQQLGQQAFVGEFARHVALAFQPLALVFEVGAVTQDVLAQLGELGLDGLQLGGEGGLFVIGSGLLGCFLHGFGGHALPGSWSARSRRAVRAVGDRDEQLGSLDCNSSDPGRLKPCQTPRLSSGFPPECIA